MSSDLLTAALEAAGSEIGDKATALIVANLRLQQADAALALAEARIVGLNMRVDADAQQIEELIKDRDHWRSKAEGRVHVTPRQRKPK